MPGLSLVHVAKWVVILAPEGLEYTRLICSSAPTAIKTRVSTSVSLPVQFPSTSGKSSKEQRSGRTDDATNDE